MATDEQLISRIADGDALALAELYDHYAPRVLGLLVKMLPSRSDADDVLQEVFWQVWRNAGRYDSQRGSPSVWLLVMARSRALDALRRKKASVPLEDFAEPSAWSPPSGDIERRESSDRIRRALAELTDDQQQAIRLSFFGGLTHPEIAEKLATPLGTVKTRIRLGMKRLRTVLADQAPGEPSVARRGAR
jgi:RNA polymerase sigma-70 factor (ECF subfamily)